MSENSRFPIFTVDYNRVGLKSRMNVALWPEHVGLEVGDEVMVRGDDVSDRFGFVEKISPQRKRATLVLTSTWINMRGDGD